MPSANQNKGPVTQYVPVTVAQGIETKIDPNLVQPPKGLQADNVRLTTLGAHRKRFGQVLLPSVGSGNVNVASTQKQLIALNNNTLSAYDFEDGKWIQGTHSAVQATSLSSIYMGTQPIIPGAPNGSVGNPSYAFIGNVGIFCYDFFNQVSTTGDQNYWINITCFDMASGQVFWNRQTNVAQRTTGTAGYYHINHGAGAPGTSSAPFYGLRNSQVIAYQGQFVLTFEQDEHITGGTICSFLRCFTFSPSITNPVNLYTGANCTQLDNFAFPTYWCMTGNFTNSPALEFCAARNSTDLVIALLGNDVGDSGSQFTAIETNATPLTQTSTFVNIRTTQSYSVNTPITCSLSDGLNVAVIANCQGAYTVQTASGTLAGFSAYNNWNSGTVAQNQALHVRIKATSATTFTYTFSDGYVVCTGTGSGLSALTQSSPIYLSPLMASAGNLPGNNFLASEIVTYNGAPCAWVILGYPKPRSQDPALVFINLLTSEIIARAFYLQAAAPTGNRPASAFIINGQPQALLLQAAEDSSDNIEYAWLITVVSANNQVIRTPDGAIITGANTTYYDNQITRAAGWIKIPEIDVQGITQGTGGNLVTTNNMIYTYYLVLVDFDATGNAIYSSPSPPYNFTPTANNASAIIPVSNVWPANTFSTTGTALFVYRNSYANPLSYNLVIAQYMSTGSPATLKDTTLENNTGNAPLYAQPSGGEQPNDPAPPSTCGVATKTRMFLAGAERGSALYFSKPFFYGRAPEFNYGNVLDIEPSTGPIVGLGALDDVVVIFKSSYIYLLSGQGPDATGSGVFSDIANISTDRGLVDKNSIVLTNDGLYFRSQRGIELLDRSYNISYVGQSVEGLLKGASIVSAVSVPAESQVRFALSTGQTIVYDYTAQGWTTYTYNLSSVTGTAITSSQTLFNGIPYSATNGTNGGQIYAEGANTFLDDSNLYPYTVQSAHMPLAGPQGWGRVRRCNILGVTTSLPSRISVQFVYDYGQVTSSAITYDISQVGAFNIRVRAPRQVAQAVSVIVQNVTSSGTGEGSYITGIVLETSQKSGALRLPDSQSV